MQYFVAKVEGGKLPRFVSEAVRSLLEKKIEGLVKITIEDYKPGRSNSQNSYYWKVLVGGIKDHLSYIGEPASADAIHEYIKQRICPDLCEISDKIDGQKITRYSTKGLTTEQHSQLAERVRAWAAERGLQLQLPSEQINDPKA